MQQRTVNCPQCGKEVIWEPASRFRPFCSARCKTNDLSQWAQESYRIPEAEKDPENTITTEPI
ncbi:DNA gyrase inhibitor YacG [Nitrosomonas oligotropha]|uniref:DNA gyrase inhibitor YacG n=1 Tax=Nitrosomonas oligotropha TaxID=42354 RepID=UPI001371A650|nr:DNA gyrase inhibitor YacG [Nitrosomonas oligotropha]MXS83207.1 DNA gyrase inhibitor YacG [Nitrosomonas oligotropha]